MAENRIKDGEITIMTCAPPYGREANAIGALSTAGNTLETSCPPGVSCYSLDAPATVHRVGVRRGTDGEIEIYLLVE